MKKELIMILLAVMVIVTVILWFTSSTKPVKFGEIAMIGTIALVVGFALFVAFTRMKAVKAGLRPEDELSKKIMQKTASMSFYVSLYWWLFLMYFSDKIKLESHTLIGLGILGMAILFGGFWFYFNYRGRFND
jgi:peptidoglycan/LPS O-acetylase OafA/YrhL